MANRRTAAAALVLAVLLSLEVAASVVITASVSTTADGKTTRFQLVHSIHGQTLRVHRIRPEDQGRKGLIHIYDVAGGRLVILDREKQEAEIYDAARAAADVEKHLPSDRISADVKPTGRTKDVLGVRCEEYAFLLKAPLTDKVMLLRSGTAWVAKEGPGVEEYVAFFRSAGNVLVAGSIDTPKTVLAVDRTDTELYRRIAALGGIPYALDMTLDVEGSGLTARLLRRSLTWSRTVTTTAVDTTPLQEQVFAIPPGWKTKNR